MPPPMPPICRKPPDSQLPPTAPPQLTVAYAWSGTDYAGNEVHDSGVIQLFRTPGSPPIVYYGAAAPSGLPTTIILQGQPDDDNFTIAYTLQSSPYTLHTASWSFRWPDSRHSDYHHTQKTANPYETITLSITILKAASEKAPNEL